VGKIKYSMIGSNHQDYIKVLELRLKAYIASDRFAVPPTDPWDMADEFDQYAHIVIGKHKNKVVASVRGVVYPADIETEDTPYMASPPNSGDCLGFSKFCVDPDYRGTTASMDVFSFSGDITVKYQRKYIIGGGFEDIVKFYERVGVKKTGDLIGKEGYGQIGYTVLGDAKRIVTGKDVDLMHWSLLYYRAGLACVFRGAYDCDLCDKTKILARIPFVPIARSLLHLKILKRKMNKRSKRK
jgi:hypothetical protein